MMSSRRLTDRSTSSGFDSITCHDMPFNCVHCVDRQELGAACSVRFEDTNFESNSQCADGGRTLSSVFGPKSSSASILNVQRRGASFEYASSEPSARARRRTVRSFGRFAIGGPRRARRHDKQQHHAGPAARGQRNRTNATVMSFLDATATTRHRATPVPACQL